ncbi:MAG: RIP metalloprotease RseP [Bacilli bacterium]
MDIFLTIICFVLGLSILITVHELGHFLAAKMFGVYCYEFSIGFGKKIVRRKRKKGETYFCVGVIPLGGYVSMYGEDVDEGLEKNKDGSINEDNVVEGSINEEKIELPRERSLEHISKPKKALIMSAGIIMNFILGYVIYFISVSCFPYNYITSAPTIIENDKVQITDFGKELKAIDATYEPGFKQFISIQPATDTAGKVLVNAISTEVIVNDDAEKKYVLLFNNSYTSFSDLSIDDQIYTTAKAGDIKTINYNLYLSTGLKEVKTEKGNVNVMSFDRDKSFYQVSKEKIKKISFGIETYKASVIFDKEGKLESYQTNKEDLNIKMINGNLAMKDDGKLSTIGIDFTTISKWLGVEAFSKAGELWADGTTRVFVAVGDLFMGKNWDQLGGPLAILTQSSTIMKNFPFSYYIQMWGLISVNLAIMNLLPFPGLDGWHLLVTAIEGVSRRKLNAKFKQYASAIGMILLFGLMAAVLILDILRIAGVGV